MVNLMVIRKGTKVDTRRPAVIKGEKDSKSIKDTMVTTKDIMERKE